MVIKQTWQSKGLIFFLMMNRLPALTRLLNSNDPPQPVEVALIENVVELMDETIEGLEAQLAKVKSERQQCRALLSPLRRMPMDVLGEIFSHAVESAGSIGQGMKQAVVLCLVCRTWRDAAYATHRLWSSFEIRTLGIHKDWDRAERWITLSGSVPKKISVYSYKHICSKSTPSSRLRCQLSNPRLVTLLASEELTIDMLSISCPDSECIHCLCAAMESIEARPSCSWDRLKSLEIHVRDSWGEGPHEEELDDFDDETYDPEQSQSFFKALPYVTSFHLDTPSSCGGFPYIPIPPSFISHLTTLILDNDWDGDAIVKVLQSCHQGSLEELIFGCKAGYVEHLSTYTGSDEWVEGICDNPDKMFILPKLRTLRFRELHRAAFKITQFFKAPSLIELELAFNCNEDLGIPSSSDNANVHTVSCEDISADLPAFIETSACHTTLRHLSFYGSLSIKMHDLERWLSKKLLPSLSHLTFNGVYLPSEFLNSLCSRFQSWDLPLNHINTIELLNLPTESHFHGRYLQGLRRMVQGTGQWYLADTNIVVTIKERGG